MNIEDVHLVLGPCTPDAKFKETYRKTINDALYHFDDPFRNILEMNDLYEENLAKVVENSVRSSHGSFAPRKTEIKTPEGQAEEFKAPIGLDTLFGFLKGIKWSVRNVHIRFEEQNLSVGFRIEMIEFTTEKSHWNFYGGLSDLRFTRQPNKYINKELNIVHLAIYTDEQIFVKTAE